MEKTTDSDGLDSLGNAAGSDDKPKGSRIIDVTSAAVPYMRGVALPVLEEVLDELAVPVAELRRLWSSEIAYVANDDWQKVNTLEDDFNDACRELPRSPCVVEVAGKKSLRHLFPTMFRNQAGSRFADCVATPFSKTTTCRYGRARSLLSKTRT